MTETVGPTRVLLLTAPGCHYCEDAQQLLERLAREFDLTVETLSTADEPGRRLALEHGVLFPPGIFIDGAFVQYGRPSAGRIRAGLLAAGARSRAVSAS